MSLELDELYNSKSKVEKEIENFFDGGLEFTGDRGYQDLLELLNEINEEIEELENKI